MHIFCEIYCSCIRRWQIPLSTMLYIFRTITDLGQSEWQVMVSQLWVQCKHGEAVGLWQLHCITIENWFRNCSVGCLNCGVEKCAIVKSYVYWELLMVYTEPFTFTWYTVPYAFVDVYNISVRKCYNCSDDD